MKTKNKIDAFVSFGSKAPSYGRQYTEIDYKKSYPANRYRLDIVLSILKKVKPKKILDIGCGSGEPLVEMLDNGFDVRGFDYAKEMVKEAKKKLKAAGYSEGLVHRDNMEDIKGVRPNEFDCIVALGSVYYARNFDRTMESVSRVLKKGGHFIFSLRNELFSLFSMNKYSLLFFWQKLISSGLFTEATKQKIWDYLSNHFSQKKIDRKFKTVDDLNIHSIYHNPLTIDQEVLEPYSLRLKELFFYHYHSAPPMFEHIIPEEYRITSAKLEDPKDWRGLFMASAFIVHSLKAKITRTTKGDEK